MLVYISFLEGTGKIGPKKQRGGDRNSPESKMSVMGVWML
jgi:hypothetical protein